MAKAPRHHTRAIKTCYAPSVTRHKETEKPARVSGIAMQLVTCFDYLFTDTAALRQLISVRMEITALSSAKLSAAENRLLAALPRKDRLQFLSGCDLVDLEFPEILYEPQERIQHVYFPIDSFVSFASVIDGNSRLEVGMAGSEGMVGTPLLLGTSTSSVMALVQGPGRAWRMKATLFKRELEHSQPLQRKLYAYVQARMSQLAQAAACTHFHLVEERLIRWLLMTQDRSQSDELFLTQQCRDQPAATWTDQLQPGQDQGVEPCRTDCRLLPVLPSRHQTLP